MNVINIAGRIINLSMVHFVRRESPTVLVVSFGSDFLKFTGTSNTIDDILIKIEEGLEEFSSNCR